MWNLRDRIENRNTHLCCQHTKYASHISFYFTMTTHKHEESICEDGANDLCPWMWSTKIYYLIV